MDLAIDEYNPSAEEYEALEQILLSAFPTQKSLDALRNAYSKHPAVGRLGPSPFVFAPSSTVRDRISSVIEFFASSQSILELSQIVTRAVPENAALEQFIVEQLGIPREKLDFPRILSRVARKVQGYTEPALKLSSFPLHMVSIPGGTFTMGTADDESARRNSEGPLHQVTVSPFFMSRYPVTQAQWRIVADFTQGNRDLDPDPSHFKGDDHPVEQVSWYDAVEFCDRLTQATNRPYRLPTEAEWEYACRAGTSTPFSFGRTLTDEIVNYDASQTYGGGPVGKESKSTTPVDHFGIANAFGLSDMHGNVWEWCQDHWHENYEKAPKDGSAWLTQNEDENRMLRGGSWAGTPRLCRSAYRYGTRPDNRSNGLGFRVCCAAPRA